jgi:cellulose biosynthesis protein BcsQ
MSIIAIANCARGVGKTTLAVHLALWFGRQGRPAVLVDLDPQGSVAGFLGLEPADDLAHLVFATLCLQEGRRPAAGMFLTPVEGYETVSVLRGSERSWLVEAELGERGPQYSADVLRDALGPCLSDPQVEVVLDTGPGDGILQAAALSIASHVIVPEIPNGTGEYGLHETARRSRALGRGIAGIVANQVERDWGWSHPTWRDWAFGLNVPLCGCEGLAVYGLRREEVWEEVARQGRPIWEVDAAGWPAVQMDAILSSIAYLASPESSWSRYWNRRTRDPSSIAAR